MTTETTAARRSAADRMREIAACASYDAADAARRGDNDAARRHAGIAAAAADAAAEIGPRLADTRDAARHAEDAARHAGRNEHTRQTARGRIEDAARQERAAAAIDARRHAARPDATWIDAANAAAAARRCEIMGDPTPTPDDAKIGDTHGKPANDKHDAWHADARPADTKAARLSRSSSLDAFFGLA